MCDFQNATRRNALTSVRKLQAFISGLSVRATHVIRIEKKKTARHNEKVHTHLASNPFYFTKLSIFSRADWFIFVINKSRRIKF